MGKYAVKIDYVEMYKGAFVIGWTANNGFGQLTLYQKGEDQMWIDSEELPPEFVSEVMDAFKAHIMNIAHIDWAQKGGYK